MAARESESVSIYFVKVARRSWHAEYILCKYGDESGKKYQIHYSDTDSSINAPEEQRTKDKIERLVARFGNYLKKKVYSGISVGLHKANDAITEKNTERF